MNSLRFAQEPKAAAQQERHFKNAIRFSAYVALTVASGLFSPVQAKPSTWTATTSDDGATAANCSNCDENISVLITCLRGQDMREVHIMILEQRDDKLAGKQANILAKSKSGSIALTGAYSNPGEAGPYPVIKVSKSDPIFDLFSHSDSVVLTANGQSATVSMKKSKQAIANMNSACG